ncbi:hypothetical protein LUZ63_004470 [Rhynchospora breviuscula]|uniref:Uncharacterized protein n=1 Tax=Rhynchospora breviuscula TaxID=2022672 RepID=A0A9Q0D2M2_9POAL|nr:hypothetical protein LUZ63_004470 [Rhynchospora breviuscula]
MASPLSKKQKLDAPASEHSPLRHANGDRVPRQRARDEAGEEEQGLVALVEHRVKEVEAIKTKLAHYQSMLEEAEKKLSESKAKLNLLQSRNKNQNQSNSSSNIKSRSQQVTAAKPVKSNIPSSSTPVKSKATVAVTEKRKQEKQPKRKIEEKEHQDLIPSVKRSSKPIALEFGSTVIISSQHKRKLRCLELCPTNDNLFVTSALDGLINFWQLNAKIPSGSLLSTTDCLSPNQRRWPEDIAWHPAGDTIIAVYSGDPGDSQISILDLNQSGQKRVSFLEAKPHTKGLINSVAFSPWENDICFLTGGSSDHSVVLWREEGDDNLSYRHKLVHCNLHSSAVMGVSALRHKKIVLSVGADKRIIGFDVLAGRSDFKHQIEYKCMSVLPNPCDFNLYLVQSGAPGQQLGLYDVRLRRTEIHSFGWKQDSSDSQSALINQSWSPDGWHVSSGTADPKIHIFDIRYQGRGPSQSVQAHQKRVFKAMWHQSLPVLSSISSDLNVGLHRIY